MAFKRDASANPTPPPSFFLVLIVLPELRVWSSKRIKVGMKAQIDGTADCKFGAKKTVVWVTASQIGRQIAPAQHLWSAEGYLDGCSLFSPFASYARWNKFSWRRRRVYVMYLTDLFIITHNVRCFIIICLQYSYKILCNKNTLNFPYLFFFKNDY